MNGTHNMRHHLQAATLLFSLAAVTASLSAECNKSQVSYDLPVQRLDERVQALSHRSGCFVTMEPADLKGKRAKAMHGVFSPEAALVASVRGTGLEADASPAGLAIDRVQQLAFSQRIAKDRDAVEEGMRSGQIPSHRVAACRQALQRVGEGVQSRIQEQGFLSAAERATYISSIEEVERKMGAQGT